MVHLHSGSTVQDVLGGFINWLNLGHARWVVHSSTLACSWPELLMLAKVTRPSGLRFPPVSSLTSYSYIQDVWTAVYVGRYSVWCHKARVEIWTVDAAANADWIRRGAPDI